LALADTQADAIVREWRRIKELLDERLEEVASKSSEEGLVNVTRYILRGGKRFRGFITVVMARALGASEEEAVDAAIAIELVHSASLAIDDIIDKDVVRRGVKVAWLVYGVEKAVLASLLMIPVAQRMIERYGISALAHVIRSWEETVRGEILDTFMADDLKPRDYMRLAALKTGSLFRLSAVLGALAAKARWAVKKAATYGLKLGIAYQLADDIVDYTLYRRGARSKIDPSERLFERWAREELGAKSDSDVVEKSLLRLRRITLEASSSIEDFPDNRWTRILRSLPTFTVAKMLEEARIRLVPG